MFPSTSGASHAAAMTSAVAHINDATGTEPSFQERLERLKNEFVPQFNKAQVWSAPALVGVLKYLQTGSTAGCSAALDPHCPKSDSLFKLLEGSMAGQVSLRLIVGANADGQRISNPFLTPHAEDHLEPGFVQVMPEPPGTPPQSGARQTPGRRTPAVPKSPTIGRRMMDKELAHLEPGHSLLAVIPKGNILVAWKNAHGDLGVAISGENGKCVHIHDQPGRAMGFVSLGFSMGRPTHWAILRRAGD